MTGAGTCLEDGWVGPPEPLNEESQVMGVGQPVIPSEGAAKLRELPLGPDSAKVTFWGLSCRPRFLFTGKLGRARLEEVKMGTPLTVQ